MKRIHALPLYALLILALALPGAAVGEYYERPPINRQISSNTSITLKNVPEASLLRTDTLVIGVQNLYGEQNPFWVQTTGDDRVASLQFDELLFANNAGEVGAGVATYETSLNGLTHTFTVREGVRYVSDGAPVTADDFINALYLLLTPGFDGVYDLTRAGIIGAEAYQSGEALAISGIQRLSDRAFSVTFATRNPASLIYLAIPALRVSAFGDVLRPEAAATPEAFFDHCAKALAQVKKADAAQGAYGQYALTALTPGVSAEFTANADYWRGAPNITNVQVLVVPVDQEFEAIMSGQVDMISLMGTVDRVTGAYNNGEGFINLYTWQGDVLGYLGMDMDSAFFSDAGVREALAIGFDRNAASYDAIAQYGQLPGTLLFDSFALSSNMLGEQYPHDPERAARLLEDAGWLLDADGVRRRDGEAFAFTLLCNDPNPLMDKILMWMDAGYKELGLDMEVVRLPLDEVITAVDAGAYDMYFLARRLPASAALAADLFAGDSPLNLSDYSTDALDRFLAWAAYETDADRQTVIYEGLYQELYLELPFIPLYRRSETLLINARVMNATITTAHDITSDVYRFFLTDTLEGQW
ncbi:MAG: ABC transporter substrate-binding protein [Oscillospiraceae bacterium]|jgi:peptide/nickel transport system substrate-binding protein|nr:ABC transporter substrate-binding protein [Oscillospiraceae bacterium]